MDTDQPMQTHAPGIGRLLLASLVAAGIAFGLVWLVLLLFGTDPKPSAIRAAVIVFVILSARELRRRR